MTTEEKEQHWLPMKQYITKHLKDPTFQTTGLEPELSREEAIGLMYCYYELEGKTDGPDVWDAKIAYKARKMYFELELHKS